MNSEQSKDKDWVRPAHSGFEAPAIGEVVPLGSKWKDAEGNTWISEKDGPKLIKKGS